MSKLERLLAELCPDGVEYCELKEYCKILKGKQLNKELLLKEGEYPAYNGGITYSGFTDNFNVDENTTIISQGGASAGFVQFIDRKFWANAHCYYLKPNLEIFNNKYVYHFVKQQQKILMECQHGAGIPALRLSLIEEIKIPVPPLEIQAEIVRMLDCFSASTTELIELLNTELIKRKKQYEYYRDSLLTFGDEVEWKTVGVVGEVTKLAGFEFTKHITYSEQGSIIALRGLNVKKGRLDLKQVKYIDESNFEKLSRSKLYINDMLFTYVGTIGEVALVDKNDKYYLAPNVARIRFDEVEINPKFMRYYFQTTHFTNEQINKYLSSSSMKNLTMQNIRKFEVPIPPLEKQEEIANILDRFDSLCQDLSSGIPAEIKARQKQYEYYRDKLLTFKEKEN